MSIGAAELMGVAIRGLTRPARERPYDRLVAVGEHPQGFFNPLRAGKIGQTGGALSELTRGLRAAEQQNGQDRQLAAREVECTVEVVAKLGDAMA